MRFRVIDSGNVCDGDKSIIEPEIWRNFSAVADSNRLAYAGRSHHQGCG
jgi:hypothetical protein